MSLSIEQKRLAVINQFFDQYLEPFFLRELARVPIDCHLAKSMLIFSALDFYGKIHRVGENGFPQKTNGERNYSIFNDSEKNYVSFIEAFFPSEHSCKGILFYRIFRCGIMHQIVPKGAGVTYLPEKNEMFFNQRFPNGQDVPILNLFPLEEIVKQSIYDFKNYLMHDGHDSQVEQIYSDLIAYPDSFGDFMKLGDAINETPGITTIFDDCRTT
ncbi:hypothetical protein [Spirosoma flavum]|uniref:Uncharacterized protein n=1 Tax=Spirosoma flavum TaxID=2048557 RepID=A0ABW6AR29_9BACT